MRAFFLACPMAILSMGGAMAGGAGWGDARTLWTGPYLGLQAGYTAADLKSAGRFDDGVIPQNLLTRMGFASGRNPVPSMSRDIDGLNGGFYLGYMRQLEGGVVLGAEADLNVLNISETGAHPLRADGRTLHDRTVTLSEGEGGEEFETTSVAGYSRDRIKWTGGVRVRAGYAAGRFQPYVTGGLAIAKYRGGGAYAGEVTRTTTDGESSETVSLYDGYGSYAVNKKLYGWSLGAGLEFAATEQIIARVEYRYSDYGDVGAEMTYGTRSLGSAKTSITSHDLRAGVALKF